ncbi:hypothetical protein [Mucilaginibacter boryungensis]|uniref:Uncharacterized protein n=1 Tax=Mucilaginibacter boryungensis TaxID=768480 RepID=A0ABR9XH74_9SPHI|nr:hypothetical protein [Mucilaginibacter boryungensis]MBE9666738.1 hypothetical protein [Mucilaginibacter boryungensis]
METNNNNGTGSTNWSRPDENPEQEQQQNANEMPEREQADREQQGYSQQQEVQQHDDGNDASYSEQNDVSPTREKEFPSEGRATTDFTPGNHGRTTGRMVGHEPGTEGI